MVLLGNPPLFQQEDKSKKVRKGVVITFIESSNMGLNFVFGLHYLNYMSSYIFMLYSLFKTSPVTEPLITQWAKLPKKHSEGVRFC